jgi:hypothetical protein
MRVCLLHPDRDFVGEPEGTEPARTAGVDLGLKGVAEAMAGGDGFLLRVAREVLLAHPVDPTTIAYRQGVLADCLRQPSVVRELYALAVKALESEREIWDFPSSSAESVVYRSTRVLSAFLGSLRRLRGLVDSHAAEFRSEGFARLFGTLAREIDEPFFREAEAHLRRFGSTDGVLISAGIGAGGKGVGYTLRLPARVHDSWLRRILRSRRGAHIFVVADRDESGHRIVREIVDRGLAPSAAALGRSVDHMVRFFRALRTELAFYLGAMNLRDRLTTSGNPVCTPRIGEGESPAWSARGLYDVGLALRLGRPPVPNDLVAGDRRVVVVTGANQGGKSTFLRAIGLAQLMAQCGLFVGATEYSGPACPAVLTHFKREEEAATDRGKLDEELARMRALLEYARPGSLLLSNESFASTNEQEGSEIARQVVRALRETGVRMVLVTFLFDFADGLHREGGPGVLFLRAERLPDGGRTYRLREGAPQPTSYGEDLYREIFGASPSGGPSTPLPK